MQEEFRFATFNAFNLAPPGAHLYDNLVPFTAEQVEAKIAWTARQLDLLDADVVGFQEIFSQAVLKEVLARTDKYQHAHHIGLDPDPSAERLTPSVALVSRLPLQGAGAAIAAFPPGVALPPGYRDPDRFARPVVHAAVVLSPDVTIDVLVLHLKSKRPDFRAGDSDEDPAGYAIATLRSLVRRATEAAALRVLLSRLCQEHKRPRIVLGDFNDTADAVSTAIVLGAGSPFGDRLFDAYQVQAVQDRLRHIGFSSLHEGVYSTIDHILVSEEFNPVMPNAIGEVADVVYLNDHLVLGLPEASDHGQVLARLRLWDTGSRLMEGAV